MSWEELSTEQKVAENTRRSDELRAQGMNIDFSPLRIGVMLEYLIGSEQMPEVEGLIQDKVAEALEQVTSQLNQQKILQGTADGGPK